MLRPTLNEMLAGLQRTVMETLLPELTSPYAQAQAMAMIGVLGDVASRLDSLPAYHAAEQKDLAATLKALKRIESRHVPKKLRKALTRGTRAAGNKVPDHRTMESAVTEFATALALGELDATASRLIRGYLKRHTDRLRATLARPLPS
ncbi:MAG TPA: hypothetical protein VEJ86_14240 [Candidatus Binataceae bacterium]|nr:hypothetical protein [Candidatus Binataceae bacterium]